MPIDAAVIGASTQAFTQDVDARWLMAYAAGVGDVNPLYFDTSGYRVIAHPMFPVCLEWPVNLASQKLPGYSSLTPAEVARAVHAAHDLHLFRPICAGDRLVTRATVVSVDAIKPGLAVTARIDTVDEHARLVSRTYQISILRKVAITGDQPTIESAPATPWSQDPAGPTRQICVPIAAGSAHVYTECSRIWNPIHTDRQVALDAGLPGVVLHGTATLAMAVTRLVDECLAGDPTRVRRLGGRFTAMVPLPSMLTLDVLGQERGTIWFRVNVDGGEPAISQGFLCYE